MVKGYFSYLVRLWRVGSGPQTAWRASTQEIGSGERQAFSELDGLLVYLREQAQGGVAASQADTRREIEAPEHEGR